MSTARDPASDQKMCLFLEGIRKRCPDNTMVLETLGDIYTKQGELEKGLEVDKLLTSQFPENDMYWYNLACSLSLTGDLDAAVRSLKKSVQLGYDNVDWMLKDKDLDAIRNLPEVITMIAAMKSAPT
jgi:predicted Zn-dependent protease